MRRTAIYIGIMLAAFALTACGGDKTGTLNGTVTLNPVVSAGEIAPTPSPADYAARQIIILEANGVVEVMRANIDDNGYYQALLIPGLYTIDITHDGPEGTSGLPKQIIIEAGETSTLDISVQTNGG